MQVAHQVAKSDVRTGAKRRDEGPQLDLFLEHEFLQFVELAFDFAPGAVCAPHRFEAEGRAGEELDDAVVKVARQRQAAVRPSSQPVKSQGGRRTLPGTGGRRFVSESGGELKKVEWPGQQQLIQGTIVVLIACLIVGVYLYGADLLFKRLVENVLLK